MSESKVGKIFTAIPAILAEVGAVGKNKRNESQGYAYRSCDDVCDALRPLLGKHGVFPTKKVIEKTEEDFTTRNNAVMNWAKMKCEWTFHAADGSSITTETFGEGMDIGDKAINKAETGSMKNALIQVFLVMGHEDSEVPGPQDEDGDAPPRRDARNEGRQGGRSGAQQGGQGQKRTQEQMPAACPSCGHTGAIHRKKGGTGFSCWKSQGGCDHEWTTAQAVAASTPGVTTGDKIPPPEVEKTVFDHASDAIAAAVHHKDLAGLKTVETKIKERAKEGKLSDHQYVELGNQIASAEEAIEAALKK